MLGSPYFSFVAYIMKVLEFLVVRIIPTDVVGDLYVTKVLVLV